MAADESAGAWVGDGAPAVLPRPRARTWAALWTPVRRERVRRAPRFLAFVAPAAARRPAVSDKKAVITEFDWRADRTDLAALAQMDRTTLTDMPASLTASYAAAADSSAARERAWAAQTAASLGG